MVKKAKLLIFLSFSGANSGTGDLSGQAYRLYTIYSLCPPIDSGFYKTSSLNRIRYRVEQIISNTNDKFKGFFEELNEKLIKLLTLRKEIWRDIEHENYLQSCRISKDKTLATIGDNFLRLTGYDNDALYLNISEPKEFYISQDLSLLKATKLPDETLEKKPKLRKFLEQLQFAMEETVRLTQNCSQWEETLQKTDPFFLLKHAIKEHSLQVYSQKDLDDLKRHALKLKEYRRTYDSDRYLLNHLKQLKIEENPALSRIMNLFKDVTQGKVFEKYKQIMCSFDDDIAVEISLNWINWVDFQDKEVLEKIYNYCSTYNGSNHNTEGFPSKEEQLKEAAKYFELFNKLDAQINDDKKDILETQRAKLRTLIDDIYPRYITNIDSTVQNDIRNFYEKVHNSINTANEELCDEFLEEARGLLERMRDLDRPDDQILMVIINLSLILEHVSTEKGVEKLIEGIITDIEGYSINPGTPFELCNEITTMPEHEIILEDGIIKFHIKRNPDLENIQTPTDNIFKKKRDIIKQKNYLTAISHDPSFPEKHKDFEFDKALDNLEQNIKTVYDLASSPKWTQETLENIKGMKERYRENKASIENRNWHKLRIRNRE